MNEFKLDCVLFDLDGTLVDTAPDLIACLNQALARFGYTCIEDGVIDLLRCDGHGQTRRV